MNEIPENQNNFIIPPLIHSFERTANHVPIHLLHTQAYCERQIYLEHVKGIEAPPSVEMIRGSEKHDALEEAHIEKAEIELSIGDAFVKSEKEGIILISREVFVLGSATYGRIDEIIIEPARLIIIDDKPNAIPYFTNQVQVWGYCHTFKEMYQPEIPIFGALRHEDTGEITWLDQFQEEHTLRVIDGIRRIQAIFSGESKGEPTSNVRKCNSCRLRQSCKD
ncbi:hypothetical protein ACFLXT_01965 [Chloroflexota bacterium]